MKIIDKQVILIMVFLSWFGTLSPRTFSPGVAERIVKNSIQEFYSNRNY